MLIRLCLAAAATLCLAAPANAAWHVAQSKHFIIYSDQRAESLRAFASELERFDKAVRYARNMDDPPVGDGNRLTVFVMSTDRAVRELAGVKNTMLAGFYKGQVEGPVAFVPQRVGSGARGDDLSDRIFFHEYAHHLMLQALDRPLPEWVVEGFAEFLSTVRFERDGTVGLGTPAQHRLWGLLNGQSLALEVMLSGQYDRLTAEQRESVYGRGWLLTHFLTFEPTRKGQLDRYIGLIAAGSTPLEAARSAFGDLQKLDRDLRDYLRRSRLTYLKVSGIRTQPGHIDVRPLSAPAAQILTARARLMNGVGQQDAAVIADQVRSVAAKAPGDPLVLLTLAQAELVAGRAKAAEDAAKLAAAAEPKSARALVFLGRAIGEQAVATRDRAMADQLFETSRKTFVAANKLDVEDPLPLVEFYRSYIQQGIQPTANAIDGYHYASNLAPQDAAIRMNSAMIRIGQGQLAEARKTLAPIAFDPHGRSFASIARNVIAQIDHGKKSQEILKSLATSPR